MSTKLVEALTSKILRKVAIREPLKILSYKEDDSLVSDFIEEGYEYRIRVELGGTISCRASELEAARRNMLGMILESLYGEMRLSILEMATAFRYDDKLNGEIAFKKVMSLMEPDL